MPDMSGIDTQALVAELLARNTKPAAPVEIVVRHVQQSEPEARDSIEIGTPGKGGVVKVYFDASASDDEIKARVDAAFRARAYAQLKLAGGEQ